MTAPLSAVETLSADHDPSAFACGVPALDAWLKGFALQNQAAGASRTYVVHRAMRVVGYYAPAAGSVERAEAPERLGRGLARHPVPVVILARLAVDETEQRSGLGRALLKDALLRIAHAADVVGARAVVVHANDERARSFYQRFDFEPSPIDPLHLFLLVKDLKRAAGTD